MIIAKTRVEDYRSKEREMDAVALAFRKSKISSEESYRRINAIQRKYAAKVFDEDIHMFDSELGLRNFLRQIEPNAAQIEDIVKHERAHFEAAEKLGASPTYGVACYFEEDGGFRQYGYRPFVHYIPRSPKDLVAVLKAPDRLSESDKKMLK